MSDILSQIEISEKFVTTSGNNKTRTHIIRSMNNAGSLFINYKCGKNSINISKEILPKITEALNNLKFDIPKETQQKPTNKNVDMKTILEHMAQLQRQLNELK
jgi:hypothetical protein